MSDTPVFSAGLDYTAGPLTAPGKKGWWYFTDYCAQPLYIKLFCTQMCVHACAYFLHPFYVVNICCELVIWCWADVSH